MTYPQLHGQGMNDRAWAQDEPVASELSVFSDERTVPWVCLLASGCVAEQVPATRCCGLWVLVEGGLEGPNSHPPWSPLLCISQLSHADVGGLRSHRREEANAARA